MSNLHTIPPFHPNRCPEVTKRLGRFAHLVAEGHAVNEAGKLLNLTKGQTAHTWRRIKDDLGAQAV